MQIQSIRFAGFRNLVDDEISLNRKNIILTGENGQGKTNFLESVYTLCYGNSFRTDHMKEIAAHGQKDFSISARFVSSDENFHDISFTFRDGKKHIVLDGKTVRDRKELIYNIPCIVFSHDDISFVNGEHENRRRFFDQLMSMYDPIFFDNLRKYRKILMQRNMSIKENRYDLLPIYDMQLASTGLEITEERERTVEKFNSMFPDLYNDVTGKNSKIYLRYSPSFGKLRDVDSIMDRLSQSMELDIKMQTTTCGIHRDRFVIMDEYGPFSATCSTGQMRLVSILLRLAQARFYREMTSNNPVLLLDDVLLELDSRKRGLFLNLLDGYDQAFFTFLPNEKYFLDRNLEDCKTLEVENGVFTEHV